VSEDANAIPTPAPWEPAISAAASGFDRVLREILRASHTTKGSDLAAMADAAARPAGLSLVVYVVDYEQRSLRPLPHPLLDALPPPIAVDGSLGGRAFTTIAIQSGVDSPHRLWIPILDGTERLGVLEANLEPPHDGNDEVVRDGCAAIAGLIGHLLQSKNGLGDTVQTARRTRSMSVASELLWRLVPPTTFACNELVLAAVLEPSYDVGGDGYDYGVDGSLAHIVLLDALGHGLPAGLTCAVALSALRAARRDGLGLHAMARRADVEISTQWMDARFTTGVITELNLDTGLVRYVNAGHPPPALLRGGKVVRLLDGGRRLPLGLDDASTEVAEEALEPGDRLLYYTDGVIEARDDQEELFGLERLVELIERHAASELATSEILRRLSHAVLEHQHGHLQDDATLLLVEWSPHAARRTLL
jgi:serine phosphatase RsbU (regulator of sigma subunit)